MNSESELDLLAKKKIELKRELLDTIFFLPSCRILYFNCNAVCLKGAGHVMRTHHKHECAGEETQGE